MKNIENQVALAKELNQSLDSQNLMIKKLQRKLLEYTLNHGNVLGKNQRRGEKLMVKRVRIEDEMWGYDAMKMAWIIEESTDEQSVFLDDKIENLKKQIELVLRRIDQVSNLLEEL